MEVLFLDRDGVINYDLGYVHRKEDFHFISGIFCLCRLANEKNMEIIIVTNQSGIGRGYYTEEDFRNLTNWMLQIFLEQNIKIKCVYHCPHTMLDECVCRKPKVGMLKKAEAEFNVNLKRSILIGDNDSDIKMGLDAGIGLVIGVGNKIMGKYENKCIKHFTELKMAYQEIMLF